MVSQLQVMSSYTLLQSSIALPTLVQQAHSQGYSALALCDVNVTYGLVDFYKLAHQAHLKPLLGMTLQVGGLVDQQTTYPWLVLAKNNQGYQQLLKLSTAVMTTTTPLTLQDEQIELTDLILIAPPEGELKTCLAQDSTILQQWSQNLQAIKPQDLYIGVSLRKDFAPQAPMIARWAELQQLPIVALNHVQYLKPQDAFATAVLQHIERGEKITHYQAQGDYYLRSAQEFQADFQAHDLKSALDNTEKIAAQCNVQIPFIRTQLPNYPTPKQVSSINYLTQLVQQGLTQHFANKVPDKYQKRAQHELKVIEEMGYADYFLIVWDVVEQAHRRQIMTGPGRGSAAGSLVSYLLGITQIDPLEYGLLFERFLNPERVDMPDIDLDIPDNRRDELVQYMYDRYGAQHMSQIITFGTFAAKQAVRDVGRILGLSTSELSQWSRAIPSELGITLRSAYQKSPALRQLYQYSNKNKLLFQTALKIENLPRHFSTHAAGIVLSSQPLVQTVALQRGSTAGPYLTQQTKNNVEALGLLKIDFLGLRNLSILQAATQFVQKNFAPQFDPQKIPLNDEPTLQLFQRGETGGVFQFESAGIRSVLRRLQPTSFDDIVATNALYRPGPMKNINHFIARKHQQEPITYPDASLKPILEPTYGILVYQEQVMQVVAQMAGFSLAEADLLRRAMAKKNKQLIDTKRTEFIQRSLQRGHQKHNAQQVYAYIENFANYGFNKSHAVAYSRLAYSLAYLKVHYPQAFFAALLNSNLNNDQKVQEILQTVKMRDIKILGPAINVSQRYFSLEQGQLRFGLLFIKKLRRDFITNILKQRQQGRFVSLTDFLQRLEPKFCKTDNILPLIYSGALDEFNHNRNWLVQEVDGLIENVNFARQNRALIQALQLKKHTDQDFSPIQKLQYERQFLGVYISGHPITPYKKALANSAYHLINPLTLSKGQRGWVLYMVNKVRVIRTKKGAQMAFVQGGDEIHDYNLTVFPGVYQQVELLLNQVYLVEISVNTDRQGQKEYIGQKFILASSLVPTH